MAAVSALAESKLMFMGEQSLTKTSVISRFIYHRFHTTYQASIGVDFRPKSTCFEDPTRRLQLRQQVRRHRWRTPFALDTSGSPSSGDQDNKDGDNTGLGRTRLGIIVRAAARQLLEKLNAARKNFPMKIFLLLLGFYTANALATILGQTGDWDVLVAGVVVSAIEGIGMLMYRKPFSRPVGRFQSFIVMVNYWKAGVCLGLFVDAFKLGS